MEDDHWPARTRAVAVDTGVLLDLLDLLHRRVERRGHGLVHQNGLVTLDEVGRPPVAAEQLLQFLAGDAGEKRRVGNLVAVEMQDRQYRAVGGPGGRGVRSHRPERMAERIAQLAAFVDRAWALRRCMAGNSSGKRELNKELPEPGFILADVGIDLAVSALQVCVTHDGRTAVPRA